MGRDVDGMTIWKKMLRSYQLYILIIPAVVCIVIFSYLPMYGVQIAFRDYKVNLGAMGSPWVGLKYFLQFFDASNFSSLINNTFLISFYSLICGFPAPIILALLLNQLNNRRFKSFVQTVTYAPYFISTVVLIGMLSVFLSPSTGFINNLIVAFGGDPVIFMTRPEWFRTIYVTSGLWQGAGWNAVIYLAALGGINPELYEAAEVDGASRFKRLWHIDLPGIMPTIIIMFILAIGGLMSVGYEKAYLMQNAMNSGTSEIISTYAYKVGLLSANFSFGTAIGLFNSIINFILLIAANMFSKRLSETSLW